MVDKRYVAEIAKFYTQNGALHWSHRNWIARHLVEAGKQVPADDRAMLDAIRETGVEREMRGRGWNTRSF